MIKRVLLAITIGVLATAALIALSFAADSFGFKSTADVLLWQNSFLQSFAPLGNMGTPEHPVYEGTPLNFLAFLASIPLGIIVYSIVAYVALFMARRRV